MCGEMADGRPAASVRAWEQQHFTLYTDTPPSNGNLYARTGDRWGRDSRLRLEILADLSHGHAQVSPVDPSCPVPHSRLKIED